MTSGGHTRGASDGRLESHVPDRTDRSKRGTLLARTHNYAQRIGAASLSAGHGLCLETRIDGTNQCSSNSSLRSKDHLNQAEKAVEEIGDMFTLREPLLVRFGVGVF